MVCLNPALPSVRDEHGDVVKLGTVSNENIKPVVDESVNRVMEETIDMVVEKDVWILLDESFSRFFDKAVDRVENIVVDKLVNEALEQGLDSQVDCVVNKDVASDVDKVPSPGADGDQGVNVQGCSMDVQLSLAEGSLQATAPGFCSVKKVKLSSDTDVPMDSRLSVRGFVSCSLELHHKAAGARKQGNVSGEM